MTAPLVNILLIEDNAAHATLIRHAVQQVGPNVRLFHLQDGAEATKYIQSEAPYDDVNKYPRPDVVFLDLNLPGSSGFMILREIRAEGEFRYTPVVILTSSESREDIRNAYKEGANAYLVKPIGFLAFKEVLGTAITFWAEHNQVP